VPFGNTFRSKKVCHRNGFKNYSFGKDFDRNAEGRFSLPLAFFIEVAISQISPLNQSWAKVKKLSEQQFYLKFLGGIILD